MRIRKLLDLITILTASIAHFVSGITIVNIGRVHSRLFSEMDMELPLISKLSASYTATAAPIIAGAALALATLVGLGLVLRSERLRWMFPFLLALSFVVVILHIVFVSFGVTLPLMRITYSIGQ